MALQSKLGTLAIVGLCVATAACHKSSRRHHGGGGASVFSFVEVEPNNLAFDANYLGTLAIGETLIVRGFIEDTPFDPFDGFAVTALEPMDVEFYLTSDDPFTDLDLCYYNPYSGQYEACWETSFNPEAGLLAMNGGEEFHLVVASYFGASSYTLEIRGIPIGYAPAASAPEAREASGAPAAGGPAVRERVRPFADYAGAVAGAEPLEPLGSVAPRVRGRMFLIDPGGAAGEETIVTQDFALGASD